MPNIEDQLRKKKPFKKKTARSYLGLGETLDDLVCLDPSVDPLSEVPALATKLEEPPQEPSELAPVETSSKVVAKYKQSSSNTQEAVTRIQPASFPKPDSTQIENSPISAQSSTREHLEEDRTLTPRDSKTQPNYEQSDSKVVANYEQSDSKVVANTSLSPESDSKVVAKYKQSNSKPPVVEVDTEATPQVVAKYKQSGSKVVANYEQSSSNPTRPELQSGSKVVAQLVAEVEANYEQTGSKLVATTPFAKLTGLQRIVALFIYEECKRLRNKVTDEISILDLIKITQADINTTKNAVHRLIQKGVIGRFEYKDGRAGWTRYELADSIYQEIREREFSGKLVANWKQTDSKVVAEPVAQLVASASSSSSSLLKEEIIKTTTEIRPSSSSELPSEWDTLDYSALQELAIPFGKNHIRQIYSRNWCASAKDLQESLNHFAYFMANATRDKMPKEPIGHFMAIMRDGHYYGRPDGYLSAEERAKKIKLEEEERKAEQIRAIQQKRFDALFEQWFASLKGSEIHALSSGVEGYDEKKKFLKFYFLEHHWLDLKDQESIHVPTLKPMQEDEYRSAFEDLDQRIHEFDRMNQKN